MSLRYEPQKLPILDCNRSFVQIDNRQSKIDDGLMAAALITALLISIGGLGASIVLGFTASTAGEILRHTTFAIFVTLVTLLSHSMTMFYLIGKGRAVREAVTESGLSPRFVADIGRIRRPVFSIGTLAMALTMATAIVGGGVDTGAIPAGVHSMLALSSLAANLAALRAAVVALMSSAHIVHEVDRLLSTS